MAPHLASRRAHVLKLIVDEYIDSAMPVGSGTIVRKHGLPVSPATIRNEMVQLEAEGYITHPHTSAGRVPSDRGYRYYVESLMVQRDISEGEKRTIRHQFHQVALESDEWNQLAAAILAQAANNIALVSYPRSRVARFRHLHLVSVQDLIALMVVVLQRARLHQQLLPLPMPYTQQELEVVANRLNHLLYGLSAREIRQHSFELSPFEEQITETIGQILHAEDSVEYPRPAVDGIREALQQPEFYNHNRIREILDVIEEGRVYRVLFQMTYGGDVRVIIGTENPDESLREYSMVISDYGVPGQMEGTIGVLGPTRMHYDRTIATVRYLTSLLNELVTAYLL